MLLISERKTRGVVLSEGRSWSLGDHIGQNLLIQGPDSRSWDFKIKFYLLYTPYRKKSDCTGWGRSKIWNYQGLEARMGYDKYSTLLQVSLTIDALNILGQLLGKVQLPPNSAAAGTVLKCTGRL